MSYKALTYAEDSLGVHRTWVNTEELVVRLQDLYRTQAGLEAGTRNLQTEMDRRRAELLDREVNANTEMAVTAFERHMKLVIGSDAELAKLTDMYNKDMAHRGAVEADIRGAENNLKAHVARLNELGGYFNYLAAAKSASVSLAMQVNDSPW